MSTEQTLSEYQHLPVADAIILGITSSGDVQEETRDAAATALLDQRDALAEIADNTGLSLTGPKVPPVGLALLVHRQRGNLAQVVNDPDFVGYARAHLGLSGGFTTGDAEETGAWIDPLREQARARRQVRDEVNQARTVAGVDPWSDREFIVAADLTEFDWNRITAAAPGVHARDASFTADTAQVTLSRLTGRDDPTQERPCVQVRSGPGGLTMVGGRESDAPAAEPVHGVELHDLRQFADWLDLPTAEARTLWDETQAALEDAYTTYSMDPGPPSTAHETPEAPDPVRDAVLRTAWHQKVTAAAAAIERGEMADELSSYVLDRFGPDIADGVAFLRGRDNYRDTLRQVALHHLVFEEGQTSGLQLRAWSDKDQLPYTYDAEIRDVEEGDRDLVERFTAWMEQRADQVDPVAAAGGRDLSALAHTEAVAGQYEAARTPTLADDQAANAGMTAATAAQADVGSARGGGQVLAAAAVSQAAQRSTNARLRQVVEMVEEFTDPQEQTPPRSMDRRDYPARSPQVDGPTLRHG